MCFVTIGMLIYLAKVILKSQSPYRVVCFVTKIKWGSLKAIVEVSIPLPGRVFCNYPKNWANTTNFEFVSIPLPGRVFCNLKVIRLLIKIFVSIPLPGRVFCNV